MEPRSLKFKAARIRSYTEYNAAANTDDGSCATPVVEGCTDPDYTEYDVEANTDDGSCATLVVEGCTNPAYTEYNASANTDDGSCATLVVEGCTNPAYTEYNASANTDDGSCSTSVVEGCTDPADVNYNAAANTDDGSCASNPCGSIEFDGYTYSLVEIGDQCWFAENLRTTIYADGTSIPVVTGNGAWTELTTGARCDYNNDASNVASYGRLYNWYAVNSGSGLCPSGWHVPTDEEWMTLEMELGMSYWQAINEGWRGTSQGVGTQLKSTSGWPAGGNGTDDVGFSALPSGHRLDYNGGFTNAGYDGWWWSSSPNGGRAWYRVLYDDETGVNRFHTSPLYGFSVRCLKDAE